MKRNQENKPTLCIEISLSEYTIALKQLMNAEGIHHITGLVESPILTGKLSKEETGDVVGNAILHGVFVGNEHNGFRIDPLLHGFIEKYCFSKNIVVLYKPVYNNKRLISFACSGNVYLCIVQDAEKDRICCLADADIHKIYDYLEKDIISKDKDRSFDIKKFNAQLEKNSINEQLKIKPHNRVFLSTVNNQTGKSCNKEILFHISGNEYEYITLAPEFAVESKKVNDTLAKDICDYIISGCPSDNDDESIRKLIKSASECETDITPVDPEPFTPHSFFSLVNSTGFPHTIRELISVLADSIRHSFQKKAILKRVAFYIVGIIIFAVWNIFATCYLNDTFRLTADRYAVFKQLTPYLLTGQINTKNYGLDLFQKIGGTHASNLYLTSVLYSLTAVCIKTLYDDIKHRRIGRSIKSVLVYKQTKERYRECVGASATVHFFTGILISSFLNILIYNPLSVFLLGMMLVVSASKGDLSRFSSSAMTISSVICYKGVTEKGKRPPRYSVIQLLLTYTGYGLLLNSLINLLLWIIVRFDHRVRLGVVIICIILAIVQICLHRSGNKRPPTLLNAVLFLMSITTIVLNCYVTVLADDGGWTESGGNLGGLIRNEGFGYILGFSLIAGLIVAATVILTGGVGAIPLVAGILSGTAAGIWAAQGENYKIATNLMCGDRSPFANDSEAALKADLIDMGISFIPVLGDVVGALEAVRDLSYAIEDGDTMGELLSLADLGLSVFGLGEVSGELRTADSAVDVFGKGLADNIDDMLQGGGIHSLEKAIDEGNIADAYKAAREIDTEFGLMGDAVNYANDKATYMIDAYSQSMSVDRSERHVYSGTDSRETGYTYVETPSDVRSVSDKKDSAGRGINSRVEDNSIMVDEEGMASEEGMMQDGSYPEEETGLDEAEEKVSGEEPLEESSLSEEDMNTDEEAGPVEEHETESSDDHKEFLDV